jgi:branched-chain amino acid transport system substrate-binding protein
VLAAGLWLSLLLTGCTSAGRPATGDLVIGAVYPLTGQNGGDGKLELSGLRLAVELIDQRGGVGGRQVRIVTADAPSEAAAPAAVDSLVDRGIGVLVGTNGSTIALPATRRASERGALYLETGAVADSITARGLPGILRTVATGGTLGRKAADFAHDFVLPGLKLAPAAARTVVLFEGDTYGASVGYGAIDEAGLMGLNVVDSISYDAGHTDFTRLAAQVDADRPDLILTASYLEDALAFRHAALARHLKVRAIVGTSSAYCRQDFGDALGQDAVGLYASDKPNQDINEAALTPAARDLLHAARDRYLAEHGGSMSAEAVSGFVGGWVLLHEVAPRAASLSRDDLWKAAMAVDLPAGSEINGAGVRFAAAGQPDMGQNRRAASVIWEWLSPGHRAVVYPPAYAQAPPRILSITT